MLMLRPRGNARFALVIVGSLLCLPLIAHAQTPAPGAAGTAVPTLLPTDTTPVVTVGGQAITRRDYEAALEQQAGKAVLNKLVYTLLVRQAAAKAGVLPSDADVTARLADLSRRNPQVQAQVQDPVHGPQFREDLRTDIALENLRIRNVAATEDEISAFYAGNKSAFTLPSQAQTTMVVTQNQADATLAESLLRQGMTPEEIALRRRLHVAGVNGFNVNMADLPPAVRENIGKTVLAMTPGQVKTLPAGKVFFTFKLKSAEPTSTPPLSQIHEQVARQVKLQKAVSAQEELARLYAAHPPTFSDPKYDAYFSDISRYLVTH